jgi:hypothetical protein
LNGRLGIFPDCATLHPGGACRAARDGDKTCALVSKRDTFMKLILTVLGVILLVVAGVYFVVPADQLPAFFPGHQTGVARMHYKHGVSAAVVGLALLAAGWWVGRR